MPRQILPGRSYLITRRCTQRQFLLRPCRITNHNVEFCLALAAERTGVLLHAVCVMSNHWHGVLTDPEARLPEFLETFHKLLAKAVNVSLDRRENLWSADKTSVVLLASEEDVLDKMAYTLANPTLAGLVRAPEEWPGVISKVWGESRDIEMPDEFFDGDGDLPDSVTLQFTRPLIFSKLSDLQLQIRLRVAVAELVRGARDDLARRGVSFLGRDAVLRQSVDAMPRTSPPRTNLSPRIAAKSLHERVAALERLVAFLRGYRAAWHEWRKGKRGVVFPAGTYALRVQAGVTCAPMAAG